MTDRLPATAHRTARLANQIDRQIQTATDWLTDRTPDGYPTSTSGGAGNTGQPANPTLTAITATPQVMHQGQLRDLRSLRAELEDRLTAAADNLEHARNLIWAIPQEAQGNTAALLDHERRHARCEGWAIRYALCDDNAVKNSVVNGSTVKLCHACYVDMWRTTDGGPHGRTSRDPTSVTSPRGITRDT